MPWVKERPKPFAAVGRLLKGYDVTPSALASKTGWSYGKAQSRIKNPATLTLAELDVISRGFHIPMDEIRSAIRLG